MTDKPRPKERGYDSDKHSSLPYVDKPYKAILDMVADIGERNKKRTVELAILALARTYNKGPEAMKLIDDYKDKLVKST